MTLYSKRLAMFGVLIMCFFILSSCGSEESAITESQDHPKRVQNTSAKNSPKFTDNQKSDETQNTDNKQDNESESDTAASHENVVLFYEQMTYEVKDDGISIGTFEIDITNIAEEHEYELENQTKVEILQFFPDYYMDQQTNEPTSETDYPINPLFIIQVSANDYETNAAIGVEKDVFADDKSPLEIELIDFNTVPVEYQEETGN